MRPHLASTFSLFTALAILSGCGGGGGSSDNPIFLEELAFGRLVRVTDVDGVVHRENLLIGSSISSTAKRELTRHPLTQVDTVRILHPGGSVAFEGELRELETSATTMQRKGPQGPAPWSATLRDAALRLRFSGPIDPESVGLDSLGILVGSPPQSRLSFRIVLDPLRPELLTLDPEVSSFEAAGIGLPINPLGLPAAISTLLPNLTLRIQTRADPLRGIFSAVSGVKGSLLDIGDNPVQAGNPTAIEISFRTMTATEPAGEFLAEPNPPRILRSHRLEYLGGDATNVRVRHLDLSCPAPVAGEWIEQGSRIFVIERVLASNGSELEVEITPLHRSRAPLDAQTPLTHVGIWDPQQHEPTCAIQLADADTSGPVPLVSPRLFATLRFSTRMDPASVSAFDSFFLSRSETIDGADADDYLIGQVFPSVDARTFRFAIAGLGAPHQSGQSERYWLHVRTDPSHPQSIRAKDGRNLEQPDLSIALDIDPDAPDTPAGQIALRFESADEDGDSRPDWAGQAVRDAVTGTLSGAPATRFSATIDATSPVVANHLTIPGPGVPGAVGLQTPLVPLGSRLQTVWRYIDLGLRYDDVATHDIDVESISWTPGGTVFPETYSRLQILLGHSRALPDEAFTGSIFFPRARFPASGLSALAFDQNPLPGAPLRLVHDGAYTVNPILVTTTGTGTRLHPWPPFRDGLGRPITFTWRDTTLEGRGGANGGGADPLILNRIPGPAPRRFAGVGNVPTIGLPLLMEFRMFPDTSVTAPLGNNGLAVSFFPGFPAPNQRVFSSGGVNAAGITLAVDPTANVPQGPLAAAVPTPGDFTLYWGQCDFVKRISRQLTRWFDTGVDDPAGTFPIFFPPVIEPTPSQQRPGTNLRIAYRGADRIEGSALVDAGCVDPYGIPSCGGFMIGQTPWSEELAAIDGKRYIQMRFSFESNIQTGDVARLASLGLTWESR